MNKPLKNHVLEVGGHDWLVREAESIAAAYEAISMARVRGSVACEIAHNDTVFANVVRLNEDGTEAQPS